jgi:hypothetical protein
MRRAFSDGRAHQADAGPDAFYRRRVSFGYDYAALRGLAKIGRGCEEMRRLFDSEFLHPNELAMCQRVLEKACMEVGLDHNYADGEIVASIVLSLFQVGITDEAALIKQVRIRRDNFLSSQTPTV